MYSTILLADKIGPLPPPSMSDGGGRNSTRQFEEDEL
jgi:hypothetical protein